MVAEIVVRQCVEGEVAALEAAEPPGSGIARHLLNLQAGATSCLPQPGVVMT
jgi:hypothetical protein